jgi:tetratricopeptide (TPR) repeat protein
MNSMKKLILFFAVCIGGLAVEAQVKMPPPSPAQVITQEFGLGMIEVRYSRPAAKGRKVFGDLVPFNKLWRTGANSATLVRFTEPVEINGKKIDTGSYALYSIPGYDSWEVILNKGINNWGLVGYKESEDVLRIRVAPIRLRDELENFTIQFDNIKPQTCELLLKWEKTAVLIPIQVRIKDKLRAQLNAALLSDKKPYWQAAQFFNEYDNNQKKALEYVRKAVEENPKAYWIWLYKAKIEKEAGDKKGAMESSRKSLELARAAKNEDYVKMNEELQKRL